MCRIVLFAIFGAIILATNAANFQDCGSDTGEIVEVVIGNCESGIEDPCEGAPGVYFPIMIKFTAPDGVNGMTAEGFWNDDSIFSDDNVCDNADDNGIECPTSGESRLDYYAGILTKEDSPTGEATLKWMIKDSDSQTIVCATFSITLK